MSANESPGCSQPEKVARRRSNHVRPAFQMQVPIARLLAEGGRELDATESVANTSSLLPVGGIEAHARRTGGYSPRQLISIVDEQVAEPHRSRH